MHKMPTTAINLSGVCQSICQATSLGKHGWSRLKYRGENPRNIVLNGSPDFPCRFDTAFAKLLWPFVIQTTHDVVVACTGIAGQWNSACIRRHDAADQVLAVWLDGPRRRRRQLVVNVLVVVAAQTTQLTMQHARRRQLRNAHKSAVHLPSKVNVVFLAKQNHAF